MLKHLLAAVAFTALAATAHAQTPEQQAAVARAAAVGLELYEHDQAAWHGTDAMQADIPNPDAEGFVGWITERTGEDITLLFVRRKGDELYAGYRATYRDGAVQGHGRVNIPLTDAQRRIYQARQLVITTAQVQTCAPSYNTVTLPRAQPGPDGADIDVYIMPAFEDMRHIPFGGHYRVAVDTGANLIRETARFTTQCFTSEIQDHVVALGISQIIGDTPTEIHVFLSLSTRLPIVVVSRSGSWTVAGNRISYLDSTSVHDAEEH